MKLIITFMFLCLCFGVKARCRFHGECIEIAGHAKPCPVNEEARPFLERTPQEEAQEALEILARR